MKVCTSPDPCTCTEFSRCFCKFFNVPKKPRKTGLKRTKIKVRSNPRTQEMKSYNALKEAFLTANPYCAVFPQKKSAQVHHLRGRNGYADQWARERGVSLLLDVRWWAAVSAEGHQWLHSHPKEAREKGWLL